MRPSLSILELFRSVYVRRWPQFNRTFSGSNRAKEQKTVAGSHLTLLTTVTSGRPTLSGANPFGG